MIRGYYLKMIINTVIFLTVISIIGKYEGVHCLSYIELYLESTLNDFELFNVICHRAIYKMIQIGAFINEKIFKDWKMKHRKINMYNYMFRLHRIYYIWIEKDTYDLRTVLNYVDVLITNDIWKSTRSKNSFEKDYIRCNEMLKLLSRPTEKYIIEENLRNIFNSEGDKYIDNPENINANLEIPVTIEYGFILLLLTDEEIIQFKSSSNEDEKKILVVQIMKEAVKESIFIINRELKEIGCDIVNSIKMIEDRNNPTVVKMKIIKSMIMKIIDATEAIFNIHGMEQTYMDLMIEYTHFISMVNAKIMLYHELEINAQDQNYLNQYNIIEDRSPGRLTIDNLIRVPIFQCINQREEPYESFMRNLLNSNNNINLLLEVHGWTVTIIEYANLMKNSMTQDLTRKRSHETMEEYCIKFNEDRAIINDYLIIYDYIGPVFQNS